MTEFILKYWLETIFSGSILVIGIVLKKLYKELLCEMEAQKAIRLGLQAMLRDRLIQSYNHHTIKEYLEIHDRDNLLNMYNQYHQLGANGVIDGLMEDLFDLPIRKGSDKDGKDLFR